MNKLHQSNVHRVITCTIDKNDAQQALEPKHLWHWFIFIFLVKYGIDLNTVALSNLHIGSPQPKHNISYGQDMD